MKVEEPIKEIIKQLYESEDQMILGDTYKILKTFDDQKYIDIAKKRIKDLKEGNLKWGPINKPIHKPKATDKIARMPKEWQNASLFNSNGKYQ